MKFQVYEGRGVFKNRWRWRIVARNGRIVACSGEAFYSRRNAERSLWGLVGGIHNAYMEGIEFLVVVDNTLHGSEEMRSEI